MKIQTFTVEGSGFFPLDMLRYDSCFPDTQEDVGKLDRAYSENLPTRKVGLRRYVANTKAKPTVDRWASFGWKVLHEGFRTY